MKKIALFLSFIWISFLGFAQLGGGDFDPGNPGDPGSSGSPTPRYTLTLRATPSNGGSFNVTSTQLQAGSTYNLYASPGNDFRFVAWLSSSGDTLSHSQSYTYTMPSHNVEITGVFAYAPSNPSDPTEQPFNRVLSVSARPSNAGSFNIDRETMASGSSRTLYAYTNTDYVFRFWTLNDSVVSTNREFTVVMPENNLHLVAHFAYNPASPGNPNANHWNPTTGEVIADDFSAGNLNNTISNLIGNSSRNNVSKIVVAGVMNSNDFGIANNYSNCAILDLSRVTGIIQIPSYAFDYTNVESVYLPASIESIGYGAFMNCSQLVSLYCYALTPPSLNRYVFSGVSDELVIFVPESVLALYQEADGWSDFTLLPIMENVSDLTISMPDSTNMADYEQMWLEITNKINGQKQNYVITGNTSYTFQNLIDSTTWSVEIKNQKGDVFGRIETIEIGDNDTIVQFASLLKPQSVQLNVFEHDSTNVTSNVQITWLDNSNNYLHQGQSITKLPSGKQLKYGITLPQSLATKYKTSEVGMYIVNDSSNIISIVLDTIEKIHIQGKVKDEANNIALANATISISQTFGGKYTKTTLVSTNTQGVFSTKICNVPTTISVSMAGYVSQTLNIDSLIAIATDTLNVQDIALRAISGVVVDVNFTYTNSVETGEQPDIINWYNDYNNVEYTVYNRTKNKNITQFNVQYPQIVLMEEVDEGDVLRLRAISKNNSFARVERVVTVDTALRASVTFDIVELGKIFAEYDSTRNNAVIASLYNSSGNLVNTYNYSNRSLTISNLADGTYTLVSMGSSRFLNTIYKLSEYSQAGLTENVHYVKDVVTVESGVVSTVMISEIPELDESAFYYTGDGTSFTVNKPSVVIGNYLTLTGRINFKPAYASGVSNVQLIVDLPSECMFVDNSVMVGNGLGSYTTANNRVVIPLSNYTDRVRFCVIPTEGGSFAPSAFVRFTLNGETITQPIGAANYEAKNLSIKVPKTVAKTDIVITGEAKGNSLVEIYDNNTLIGQTTALGNGTWKAECTLVDAYNLSTHSIYAKTTTSQGMVLMSETKECFYDMNAIQVSTVTMINFSHRNNQWSKDNLYEERTIFDFINPPASMPEYWYWPDYPEFTFLIDFTNNDTTKVSNVVLYVETTNGNYVPLDATYDTRKNLWVASGEFGSWSNYDLPTNVSVDFDAEITAVVDRDFLNQNIEKKYSDLNSTREYVISLYNSFSDSIDNNDSIGIVIKSMLSQDTIDMDTLETLLDAYLSYLQVTDSSYVTIDSVDIDSLNIDYDLWYSTYLSTMLNDFYIFSDTTEISLLNDLEFIKSTDTTRTIYKKEYINSIDETSLFNLGYNFLLTTDSTKIYYLYDNDSIVFIDAGRNEKYSIEIFTFDSMMYRFRNMRSINSSYYLSLAECSESIGKTVKDIKEMIGQDYSDTKDLLTNFGSKLSDLLGYVECFYSNGRLELEDRLKKVHTSKSSDIESKKSNRENIVRRLDNDIKSNNLSIKNLGNRNKFIQEQVRKLYNLVDGGNLPQSLKEIYEKQIFDYELEFRNNSNEIASLKGINKQKALDIFTCRKQINMLDLGKLALDQTFDIAMNNLKKLPLSVINGVPPSKWLSIGSKFAGPFGSLIDMLCLGYDVYTISEETKQWGDLLESIQRKLPCENDREKAESLYQRVAKDGTDMAKWGKSIIDAEYSAIAVDVVSLFLPPQGSLALWFVSGGCNIYAEWTKLLKLDQKYIPLRGEYYNEKGKLKCFPLPNNDPNNNKPNNNNPNNNKGGKHKSNNPPVSPVHDPSGYVYEGVHTNRLEGVTATCYYKDYVEDMYGDFVETVVLWDAENYAQENPLFTDENGMYRWDVPQGMWQVKFEKEGYETTYSEWLPVPPPQLEVNIGMTQTRQPQVLKARAYDDAVEIEFDKYMKPYLLNTNNIIVFQNDSVVSGSIELLNEEYAYKEGDSTFASKVRFNADTFFTANEITLLVTNQVKSYADIRMQENFMQTFQIEHEIKRIVCDSAATVNYGRNKTLTVSVLPATASAGKTLIVDNVSKMILGVATDSVVLDSNGVAQINVRGELPGTSALRYSIKDYDISATSIINVPRPIEVFLVSDTSACEELMYDGVLYTETTVFRDTVETLLGDTISVFSIIINNSYDTTVYATICPGDTYEFASYTASAPGTYIDTLQSIHGCDSIVRTVLTMGIVYDTTITASICANERYSDGVFSVNTSGTYIDTLQTINGCDSIVRLVLTVNPLYDTTINASICSGETYTANGFNVSVAGTYTDTLQTINGCDSIVRLVLAVNPVYDTTIIDTICANEMYTDNGFNTNVAGTYTDTLQTINGCDSIVRLQLVVYPVYDTTIVATICSGETYTANGFNESVAGTYTDTLQTINGCDSIVRLQLAVYPVYDTTIVAAICSGETYTANGFNTNVAGTYTDTLQTINGCDSIVRLQLAVYPVYDTTIVAAICSGETYAANGFNVSVAGTYTDTLQTINGCDSIVRLQLVVYPVYDTTIVAAICSGETYTANGFNVSVAGTYTDTLQTINGCDSIVRLQLAVYPVYDTTIIAAICSGETYTANGFNVSVAGTYTDTLQTINGCDSIVRLVLTVNNPSTGIAVVTACDSYTWIDGVTYTESTDSVTYTLTNAVGCDSVVTLNLTINYSTTGTDVITACNSYTWIDGVTYTESNNTATYTLTAANGCDSVVTLNLTINNSTTGIDVVTACDSYTWIDGVTYTESTDSATYTLTNAAGCDSVVTLNLTINYSTTGTDVITACDSYTWIDGVTYTESNDSATYTLTGANGCDSVVTLNLTINYAVYDTIVDTAVNEYVWNGTTYTESGVYQYSGTTAAGCDSIVTLILTIQPIGIETADKLDALTFYPNPTRGTITFNNTNIRKVEVMDGMGRVVATFEDSYVIDLSNLSKGYYVLRITTTEGIAVRKVIRK